MLLEVANPATGEHVASVEAVAPAAVAEVVERARAAQPAWRSLGFEGRARVLRRARRWLLDHAGEVADLLVAETGKVREDALVTEIGYTAVALGYWARRAPRHLAERRVRADNPFVAGRRMRVRYEPLGVVGVIGPWNYPLINAFGDCIPALAAGNAVVLKPSRLTPLTVLRLRDALLACGLPPGAFEVVPGGGDTAEALIDAADMVMFTGSTETGRRVLERAARSLTPVSLELGGKDAMIVLADADLERAADAAVYSSMQNGGQSCTSIERVYVEDAVHDAFAALVAERARALRQGVPGPAGSVDVGALTAPEQARVVREHVEDAVRRGARVLAGGANGAGEGRFWPPTVLAAVDHSMLIAREETFGPTLPIVRVSGAEEAVRLANDSPYGLSAAVWTRDAARGERLARRVHAGAVCVNDTQMNYFALDLPMGGWGASGMGVRHGAEGIRKYTRQQALLVRRRPGPLARELHHFPYSARRTRLLMAILRLAAGPRRRP